MSTDTPTPEDENMPNNSLTYLDSTTDPREWARVFVHHNGGDEPAMVTWFASAIEAGRAAGVQTNDYGRCGDLVRVGSAAFELEAQKRDASIARIIAEQSGEAPGG